MKYQDIHSALRREGMNWRVAAEAIGCTSQHLMNVCSRRTESRPTAMRLAIILKNDVTTIFPDVPRYSEPSRKSVHAERVAEARERIAAAGL